MILHLQSTFSAVTFIAAHIFLISKIISTELLHKMQTYYIVAFKIIRFVQEIMNDIFMI